MLKQYKCITQHVTQLTVIPLFMKTEGVPIIEGVNKRVWQRFLQGSLCLCLSVFAFQSLEDTTFLSLYV